MKRYLPILALLTTASLTSAQSLAEYLKLRRQHGVAQAVGVPTLETLVGSRVVEIQGTVKGSIRTEHGITLMLERTDGEAEFIDAKNLPDWLRGNEISARLLIKASRASETSALKAQLLGAATESEIRNVEAQAALERARDLAARQSKPLPSRGGRRTATAMTTPTVWSLPASDAMPQYAAYIKKQNKRLSNAEAVRIAQGVIGFSLKYGVDARLIMAMVMVESGFDPNAVSHAGAVGLGQLMPSTAKWMGVSDSTDSIQNLMGTVKLVRTHLNKYSAKVGGFEALVLSLAAYNAGEGAVRRHGGVPPYRETQRYVRKVIDLYQSISGLR